MSSRQRKAKKVSYELIEPKSLVGEPMYRLLDGLIEQFHPELHHARIALAWNTGWRPDVDGRVTLGQCMKASDLDRELAPYDFVIILRREFWDQPSVRPDQRKALLDHELQHATVVLDQNGEPKEDERGRTVYRLRKHDIEEFTTIVGRYGCYKRDLEWFVNAIPGQQPLKDAPEAEPVADAPFAVEGKVEMEKRS